MSFGCPDIGVYDLCVNVSPLLPCTVSFKVIDYYFMCYPYAMPKQLSMINLVYTYGSQGATSMKTVITFDIISPLFAVGLT